MKEVKEAPEAKNSSEPVDRSTYATYPYDTIKSSLELVRQIVEQRGTGQYTSRKDISIILGKAEGTLVTKLSACIQYGLLVNKFGVGYIAGDLYSEYVEPVYEIDKKKTIIKMLYNPPLYKAIIDDLNGKYLPNESGLINYLKNTFKLLPASAERAAKAFRENLSFAGVVENNRLKVILSNETPTQRERDEDSSSLDETVDASPRSKQTPKLSVEDENLFTLPIPLPKNRIAYLQYPRTDISKKDINVIRLALAFIEGSLPDDEAKEIKKEL